MTILVVDTSSDLAITGCDYSIIGYKNLLLTSTITGQDQDPSYPFSNALDYRDNTRYSPLATSGGVVINFVQSSPSEVNYLGFAIHNGQDALLSGKLEYFNALTGLWVLIFEFNGVQNNKTFMSAFQDVTSQRQRLTLNFTSKLYIGTIYMGKAKIMPLTPAIGFAPAKFSPLDTVEQFTTYGQNFIIGRREEKGFQSKGSFDYIEFDDLDTWFEDYQNHVLDSKPVFFKWNSAKPDAIFGQQNPESLAKPSYKTSYHCELPFDIKGYN